MTDLVAFAKSLLLAPYVAPPKPVTDAFYCVECGGYPETLTPEQTCPECGSHKIVTDDSFAQDDDGA